MICAQSTDMSDPLRTDGSRAQADVVSDSDRDAKIEQLLLVGLDHYFANRYELAINVWTRALFLDRSHARARAYIDRARSAMAERLRESEELLQNGVAAFHRGEGDEARRLLQAAIDGGAPSEEALAVLDRMNRLEATALPAALPRAEPARRARAPRRPRSSSRSVVATIGMTIAAVLVAAAGGLGGVAVWNQRADWRALIAVAWNAARTDPPATLTAAPVARETTLAIPRRGEMALSRARALTAGGHLRDALNELDAVRPTDAQQPDADRLRAEIQRQLLALTPVPRGNPPAAEKGERPRP